MLKRCLDDVKKYTSREPAHDEAASIIPVRCYPVLEYGVTLRLEKGAFNECPHIAWLAQSQVSQKEVAAATHLSNT